jgi:hypothetical protein
MGGQQYYEATSKFQEVLGIKCHLRYQTRMGENPIDIDILSINILPNDPLHLLLIRH